MNNMIYGSKGGHYEKGNKHLARVFIRWLCTTKIPNNQIIINEQSTRSDILSENINNENRIKNSFSYEIYEYLYDIESDYFEQRYKNVQIIYFFDSALSNLNEQFNDEFEGIIQENKDYDLYDEWNVHKTRQIALYDTNDILTVVSIDTTHANHTGGEPRVNYDCTHINKENRKVLTNLQFLEENGYDLNELQSKVDAMMEDESWIQEETDIDALWHIYGKQIDNQSCLYLKDRVLNMYISVGVLGVGTITESFEIK